MGSIFDQVPRTIAESAKSPLGVVSLLIIVSSLLGYAFFASASETVRVSMFVLMFIGYGMLGFSLVRPPARRLGTTARERQPPAAGGAISERGSASVVDSSLLLRLAVKRIGQVWYLGAALVLILLSLQTLLGKYGEQLEPAWSWIAPLLLPVTSILFASWATQNGSERRVTIRSYRVASVLAAVAVFLIAATLLLEPFSRMGTARWLSLSTLLLAPLLGATCFALVQMLLSDGRY
jgi:uncharacterized membrane protein YhdT